MKLSDKEAPDHRFNFSNLSLERQEGSKLLFTEIITKYCLD